MTVIAILWLYVITLICCHPFCNFITQNFQLYLLQDPRVLDAMLPYMTENFGNPHSRTHFYGWEAEHAMEVAREVRRF